MADRNDAREPLITRLIDTGWDESNGCWVWRGARHAYGYGVVTVEALGLRNLLTHRVIWELQNGPIPDGLVVRHRCDNPPCCNPGHLELGTHADNTRDMIERHRAKSHANDKFGGMCRPGKHDVTLPGALKVVVRPDGERYTTCVECARERSRKWKRARDAARRSKRQRSRE